MRLRLLAFVLAAASAVAGMAFDARAQSSDLTVEVSGLRNYKGHVVLMLWPDSSESSKFPDAAQGAISRRAARAICLAIFQTPPFAAG